MKILYLSRGRCPDDQIGYHTAFQNAKSEGVDVECFDLPFIGFSEKHGWDGLYAEIIRITDEWRPDVVFFQFFHGIKPSSPVDCIKRLKQSGSRPLVFGSQGDLFDVKLFGNWGRRPEKPMVDLAVNADAFFSSSMGAFSDYLVAQGARNVVFLPHAFSLQHFHGVDFTAGGKKKFDVSMVCSVSLSKRYLIGSMIHKYDRYKAVESLWRRYGQRFGLYGSGWRHPACLGAIPFRRQVDAFIGSKCAVDAPPPINEVYYASDRPFFIAGCGIPLVQYYTPRFEKILREGEHVEFVRNHDNVSDVCAKILSRSQEELDAQGVATRDLILHRHITERRVDTIISVAETIRDIRSGKMPLDAGLANLRLWHFLPGTDMDTELSFAVANWRG